MHHLDGPHLAAFIALIVLLWAFAFVVFWALVGWGASIAVRSYRWAMRNRPAQAGGLADYPVG
jgi:hypothetical protein